MKKTITLLAFMLISIGSYADALKDSLKAEYKPYFDLAVKAIESATGKTSIYGIPYSFIEGIVLLVFVGIMVSIHKKALADANAVHAKTVQDALDTHTKTIEALTKK